MMISANKWKKITLLIADDDADDREMIKEAFEENRLLNPMEFVENGVELMSYLKRKGKYAAKDHPMPGLILLDLNMPLKDGRECLKEIKADPQLRHIPIIVLTTSKTEEDILKSYDLGVSGFIIKPVTFQGLLDITKALGNYWFEIVELPIIQ